MNDAALRQKGLPIGSGAVESTCKQLVNMRFKRAGARFRPQGAQKLLTLRGLFLSDGAWQYHVPRTLAPAADIDIRPLPIHASRAA